MAQPTNSDLMQMLISMSSKQAVMDEKLDRVELQANKTNGRVTKAEEFINAIKAVEHYKKENPNQQNISAPNATTVQVMQPSKWFQSEKLVAAVAVICTAIAAAILAIWGGGQP